MVKRAGKHKCLKLVGFDNVEYDCTRKCYLRAHGTAITSALTKCSICDERLAAYVAKLCCNFAKNIDEYGRSALHMAATVGRCIMLEWLLNQGSIINGRDLESGSTPLHRAIFYGNIDCAVLLIRYGASLNILDKDFLLPLQHICHVSKFCNKSIRGQRNELLVWGTNKNYNLGVSNDHNQQQMPQILTYFRKAQITISRVAMGAFHSLFLDEEGHIYALGHGKGGRLGIGSENTLTTPTRVKLNFKNPGDAVIDISVSRNHSLLLTMYSLVFASGLNDSMQLGIKNTNEQVINFKEVVCFRNAGVRNLMKVIARDYHSLAYNKSNVYVWGTNLGQMSVDINIKIIAAPQVMKLPEQTNIKSVEADNTSTAVLTSDNLILLFHKYKMKTVRVPNYEPIKSIAVFDGEVTRFKMGTASTLKLLILTQTNELYIWYQSSASFYRCIFMHYRFTQIDKIIYKANQVLILSQGDVYQGKCTQISTPPCHYNDIENKGKHLITTWRRSDCGLMDVNKNCMICIELKHVNAIDRAVNIFCDNDFLSFAVLQDSATKYFKLPKFHSEKISFAKFYKDTSSDDIIHDLVFYVDNQKFPVHKFIIFSRAPGLAAKLISHHSNRISKVNIPNLTAAMFKMILKTIYDGYLTNEQDLNEIRQNLNSYGIFKDHKEIIELIISFTEIFQMHYLTAHLRTLKNATTPNIENMKHTFTNPSYGILPELHDLRIICENDMEIAVHKCVVVARLEYFQLMFSHNWRERDKIKMSTISYEYMLAIVKYIYDGDENIFRKQQYRKAFLYDLIILCDQFLINDLRNLCESLLLEKISIKDSGEMLDFAFLYHCNMLKVGCLDFICQNLSRILRQRCLECCTTISLKYLTQHYRNMFNQVFEYRVITPHSTAIDDDTLFEFIGDFHVDLDFRIGEHQVQILNVNLKQKSNCKFSKQSQVRYCERAAISSMKETLLVDKQIEKAQHSSEYTAKINEGVSSNLEGDYIRRNWSKVLNKSRQTKVPLLGNLQNQTVKNNEQKLSHLNENEKHFQPSTQQDRNKLYSLNMLDIVLQYEIFSKKQRRRMSPDTYYLRNSIKSISTPPTIAVKHNAWSSFTQTSSSQMDNIRCGLPVIGGLCNHSICAKVPFKAAKNSSISEANTESLAALNSSIKFHDILVEQQRQRQDYERIRNKALNFTQIEDMAIAELKQFYNVNNVADEVITVHRKPMQFNFSMFYNFPVWQRNTFGQ